MKQSATLVQPRIKSKDIKNALKGVIKFASENPHLQNQLFNEEIRLFLQINSYKIPKARGPLKQLFRVPLAHSPLNSDCDVCLIVPDVKGIPNKEHERHVEHYETLLRSKDVTGIKKIMTFHEFRTDYDTFELKNRLADLYDAFLVDGRISGKVVHKCGNIFYKKRKVPVSVRLDIPKLKIPIENSLKKAFFHLNLKSDSQSIEIGHSKMGIQNLVDNVYSIVEFIEKQFPGKMDNIRSLNVYAHRGSSIPIYVSLANPNDIKVPILSSKKPKGYKSVTGELSTRYNADVTVRPSGRVIVKKQRKRDSNEDEEENIDTELPRKEDETAKKGKKRKQSELQNTNDNDIESSSTTKNYSAKKTCTEKTDNKNKSKGKQTTKKVKLVKINKGIKKVKIDI